MNRRGSDDTNGRAVGPSICCGCLFPARWTGLGNRTGVAPNPNSANSKKRQRGRLRHQKTPEREEACVLCARSFLAVKPFRAPYGLRKTEWLERTILGISVRQFIEICLDDRLGATPDEEEQGLLRPTTYCVLRSKTSSFSNRQRGLSRAKC